MGGDRNREARGRETSGSEASRLIRMGRAGAVVAGRSAATAIRKSGASPERKEALSEATAEANALTLLEAAGDLRGLVAKLGQLLAQQGHGLPDAYVRKLSSLQRSAPPMHPSLARVQLRQGLGREPEAVFRRWEARPFAAASLGQVHRAWLEDGTVLAVKVQYPGIRRAVESDFRLMERSLSALRLAGTEAGALREALVYLRDRILAETDYRAEAEQLEFFGQALGGESGLRIPAVDLERSSERVLSMELLEGVPLDEWLKRDPGRADRDALGTRLLALFFRQAFELRRFHADPHPGNLLLDEEGGIGLIDFGCVEMLSAERADQIRQLYRIPIEDVDALDRQYRRLGLYQDDDPMVESRRDALLRLQRANVGRFHVAGSWDFGELGPLRELSACLRQVAQLGIASGPLVLFERSQFGLYNLLHQIGARVDCRQVIRPHLETS